MDKPKTVKVEALKYHTYQGKEYQVGDTYDFPEEHADGLAAGGFAVRVDRVEVAKKAKAEGDKTEKARSAAVKPMTAHKSKVRKG